MSDDTTETAPKKRKPWVFILQNVAAGALMLFCYFYIGRDLWWFLVLGILFLIIAVGYLVVAIFRKIHGALKTR
ncbi:MAG: hypothetical protein LKJ47_02545 [Bifidobacteriaceae bacterium]|jgi:membrane protein YdbS with pleckstrin-like domain|nr:hypothetical protein [Bifidobacteriaceae bacterium]